MKVYGHPQSTCTRKVLCALAEKEEKAEFVLVDIWTGKQKEPDHLAKQPWGQIPVLEDGDFRLFESRAIIRYVSEKSNKGTVLTPKDLKAKALMEQQISVEASNVTPLIMKIVGQVLFNPMKGLPTDQALVDTTVGQLAKALDIYEAFLKKYKFLGGDAFSLADVGNAPYFEYLMQTPAKKLVEERPKLAAWWKAMSERPSWQTALGKKKD